MPGIPGVHRLYFENPDVCSVPGTGTPTSAQQLCEEATVILMCP
jgi:hypothetical protein